MKLKFLAVILTLIPCAGWGIGVAGRGGARPTSANMRGGAPAVQLNLAKKITANKNSNAGTAVSGKTESKEIKEEVVEEETVVADKEEVVVAETQKAEENAACGEEYFECMDQFCMLDETEGGRCSCSDNINRSKQIIQDIEKLQADAEKLYTEGVERERLGAKAKYIFGDSEKAKRSSRVSGIDLHAWLYGDEGDLAEDQDIGDNLYAMAATSCEDILKTCGGKKKAEMQEQLYLREVNKDCKTFSSYLKEQKTAAESNKRTAEAAVRAAKLEVFGTTNKYNRGECLLAYRACIADKGGCGENFENCLDADLLQRRAGACENVLDQCLAVRDTVLEDWKGESEYILAEAVKYADKYRRSTCFAKIRNCLEEGCSYTTDASCLTDVNVAAGICPIIDECDEMVPGLKASLNAKLGEMRTNFCQNDVEKCLQDKCGVNFTAPECIGKKAFEIAELCPQSRFASCRNEKQYDIIVQSILLQLDYQMLEGCKNYYADALGRVCGTDMACLTGSKTVNSLTKWPTDSSNKQAEIEDRVKADARSDVGEFLARLETEKTIKECRSSQMPESSGRKSLQKTMYGFTKLAAEAEAERRYMSDLQMKIVELSRKQTTEEARKNCLSTYKPESKPVLTGEKDETKSYTYIKSVNFEPDLRNCHVCRIQRVCETGGEKRITSALKAGAGGFAAGASTGTMVSPGWGTLIGGAVGGVTGAVGGALSGGLEDFCQELESCEDVNM